MDEEALYRLLNTWESTESDLSPKEKRARVAAEAERADTHQEFETDIPTQETELVLRELWSRVFNTEPQNISMKVSFLSLGGDSIIAIELVAWSHSCYDSWQSSPYADGRRCGLG